MTRNMGLTPRERRVLRAIEQRRHRQHIDLSAIVVAVTLSLGIAITLSVIGKYIWG